jgi:hypothetical protein
MILTKEKTKPRFKVNVSYKHESAIRVLKSWFEPEYTCHLNYKFFYGNALLFIPDLTLTHEGTVRAIYEIVHTHGLTGRKLGYIQLWCSANYDFAVHEISADYILNKTSKPEYIETDMFYTDTIPVNTRVRFLNDRIVKQLTEKQ